MVEILGIDVSLDLIDAWSGWLAPDPQPFFVGQEAAWRDVGGAPGGAITPELRDTYRLYGPVGNAHHLWLSEGQFHALPKARRAALVREQVTLRRGAVPTVRGWSDVLDSAELRRQADGHRFVWWPSLLAVDPVAVLRRSVEMDRLTSRHREVAASTWRKCAPVLPRARRLAGTFPTGSNACCFSTVLSAADVDDSGACDSTEPFGQWLSAACHRGGDDRRPGTVLVWRNGEGAPVHAAVSIGDGWVLEKPSQDWHSPRAVATVVDVIRASRYPGQRVERHTIA